MKNEESTDPVPFLRGCEQPLFQVAADEIERLRARQKWTACSAELPDVGVPVLVCVPGYSHPVGTGYWDGDEWLDEPSCRIGSPVTHWMRLPAPPEVTE